MDSLIHIEDTLNMIFEESNIESNNDVESECDDQTVSCNCYKSSDISLDIESDQLPTPKLQSKDKLFGYSTQVPNQVGRTQAHNLYSAGNYLPRSVESRIYSPLSALKCLISQNIVDLVVNATQTCLDSIGRSFNFTEKNYSRRTRRRYISDLEKEIVENNAVSDDNEPRPPSSKQSKLEKKPRCNTCPRTADKKTVCCCDLFKKALCQSHMTNFCDSCLIK